MKLKSILSFSLLAGILVLSAFIYGCKSSPTGEAMAQTGTLVITTNQLGDSIFVDGNVKGGTVGGYTAVIKNIPYGNHTIKITKPSQNALCITPIYLSQPNYTLSVTINGTMCRWR